MSIAELVGRLKGFIKNSYYVRIFDIWYCNLQSCQIMGFKARIKQVIIHFVHIDFIGRVTYFSICNYITVPTITYLIIFIDSAVSRYLNISFGRIVWRWGLYFLIRICNTCAHTHP